MKILTKEEKAILLISLQMRRNHIETGVPHISAIDAENMGKYAIGLGCEVNALTQEQMKLVLKISKVVEDILAGEVHILSHIDGAK